MEKNESWIQASQIGRKKEAFFCLGLTESNIYLKVFKGHINK